MQHDDTDSSLKNFIVFEGIDGSGTTTQLHRFAAMMERNNLAHIVTAEPTSRPVGALIRQILRGDIEAEPGTVAYLFAADRHQHLHGREGILGAAAQGIVVLCDRYALSSLAYQGITCGKALPELLNSDFPIPGLTLFFRIDPEIAMLRVKSRNQLEIYEKLHIQKLVSASYEEVVASARAKGWNIVTIDAEKPIDAVTSQILSAMEKHLGRKFAN